MVRFYVRGIPAPKGSMRGYYIPGKMGKPRVILTEDNKHTRPWANTVRLVIQEKAPPAPWECAVELLAVFRLQRPKSLPKRIVHPTRKPDLDKLLRCIKDAMKGVLYKDDAQVVKVETEKTYATADFPPGVFIVAKQKDET